MAIDSDLAPRAGDRGVAGRANTSSDNGPATIREGVPGAQAVSDWSQLAAATVSNEVPQLGRVPGPARHSVLAMAPADCSNRSQYELHPFD
jgi:hypothetical protein